MTVDDAAAELYVGSPKDFVRRRAELVAAAREQGDRDLAAAIAALRKPTTGAWLANLLNLEHRAELEELVALGAALRDAQDVLDPDQLRELGRQRQRVVRRLVALGGLAATKHGQVPGRAADDELEATLTAALADPAAAQQLLSGRLAQGLTYAGLGFGATATPVSPTGRRGTAPSTRAVRSAAAPAGGDETGAAALAAELDAAERDLAQARLQAAAAADGSDRASRRHEAAQDFLRAAHEEVRRITAELADAEADVRAGEKELEAAARESTAAAREAVAAEQRADAAQASLQALRSR